jgi:hypothetical protein
MKTLTPPPRHELLCWDCLESIYNQIVPGILPANAAREQRGGILFEDLRR